MRTARMPKELRPLLEVAEASSPETLVLTERRRPVAALVSLRVMDRESLALSTSPEFCEIIRKSRKEIRARRTTTLEALEAKLGIAGPKRPSQPTPRKAPRA